MIARCVVLFTAGEMNEKDAKQSSISPFFKQFLGDARMKKTQIRKTRTFRDLLYKDVPMFF
jgi:hypothetical protein